MDDPKIIAMEYDRERMRIEFRYANGSKMVMTHVYLKSSGDGNMRITPVEGKFLDVRYEDAVQE